MPTRVIYFGEFGAASRVKLINNLLVSINIAATAEAMALGLKAGVDVPLMIKAIATGSGGSTQFGIRAPWMAERRFQPVQGPVAALQHYFDMIGDMADQRRRGDADSGLRHAAVSELSWIWVSAATTLPAWSTCSARCRARKKLRGDISMIRVKKIAHASYEMPDVEQQAEYYTNMLGMTVAAKEKDAVFLANTVDHHSVVLRKGAQAQCARVGFQLGEHDDLDAFEKQVQAQGVKTAAQEGSGAFDRGYADLRRSRRAR